MSNLTINTKDQFDFSFSKEAEKEIFEILKKYPPERKASAVMPLLDSFDPADHAQVCNMFSVWSLCGLSMACFWHFEISLAIFVLSDV